MSIALNAKSQINMFGLDNFGLLSLPVKDGVVQRFSLVENFEVIFGIQANCDCRMLHGVSRTFGLDLVDNFLELNGQVLG